MHELEERQSEAKRRFSMILAELKDNQSELEEAMKGSIAGRVVLPQLSDASWETSGAALGAIASDYELVAALSRFYERLRDAEWRLRRRLEDFDRYDFRVFEGLLDRLLYEMKEALPGLIDQVSKEADQPRVIEVEFIPARTMVYGTAVDTAIRARTGRVARGSGSRPVGPPT